MEQILARAGGFMANQVGGTFLSPSSTLSLPSLLVTLAIAVMLVVGRRPKRLPVRVLWRALFPRRMVRSMSGRLDAIFFLLSLGGIGVLFGWAVVSAEWVRSLAPAHAPLMHLPPVVASLIATIALFVAYEFAYWFDHWLKHRFAPLWAFHKVHHDAESLSILTNFRVHPVDTAIFYNIVALVTGAVGALLDGAIGRDAGVLSIGATNVLVMAAAAGVTHIQHSHLWFGAGFRGWLLGPAHHQIHHSADPAHHNRNFGSSLALWDRLFGTYYAPSARRPALRFGSGEPVRHTLGEALGRPFVEIAADMTRVPESRPA